MPGIDLYGPYVTKDELKSYMAEQQSTNYMPKDDQIISRFCVLASRRIDSWCNRTFVPYWDTKVYDYSTIQEETVGRGGWGDRTIYPTRISHRRPGRGLELNLRDDLLTLGTAITDNGDTTIPNADILLRRGVSRNIIPYDTLEIKSTSIYNWGYSGTPQEANSITGYWGYHKYWTNQAWEQIGTVNGAFSSSVTSIKVTYLNANNLVGQLFSPGFQEQILIKFTATVDGTEELAYITQVIVNDVTDIDIHIIREVNGTTAIALTDEMTIYAYRPMDDVVGAIYELGAYTYRRRSAIGKRDDRTVIASASGMVMLPSTVPDALKDFVKKYKRVQLGVGG